MPDIRSWYVSQRKRYCSPECVCNLFFVIDIVLSQHCPHLWHDDDCTYKYNHHHVTNIITPWVTFPRMQLFSFHQFCFSICISLWMVYSPQICKLCIFVFVFFQTVLVLCWWFHKYNSLLTSLANNEEITSIYQQPHWY